MILSTGQIESLSSSEIQGLIQALSSELARRANAGASATHALRCVLRRGGHHVGDDVSTDEMLFQASKLIAGKSSPKKERSKFTIQCASLCNGAPSPEDWTTSSKHQNPTEAIQALHRLVNNWQVHDLSSWLAARCVGPDGRVWTIDDLLLEDWERSYA